MNEKMRWVKIAVLILLLAWYGAFLFHKIDLTTSDLGRHIKNGEEILSGHFQVLNSNYYSYTEPDATFINHHWLSGVVFYLIWKFLGFSGLHLFFIALSLITFWLFFDLAKKVSSYVLAIPTALLLIPLIAERVEARPEVFSYLFSGIFLWLLWQKRGLWVLPILMLFWVNLHIYFFAGLLLIFILMLWEKDLWKVFLASSAAIFINPFGLRVIALPFTLFQNYGYKIIENQSVRFLDNLGFIQNPNLFWFKIAAALFILSFLAAALKNGFGPSWALSAPAAIFGIASAFAIRNFTVFGLFALPAICVNIQSVSGQKIKENKELAFGIAIIFSALILIISFFTHQTRLLEEQNGFGLGLAQDVEGSAEFFKKEKLKGPIFNNYDIGSYLIFNFPSCPKPGLGHKADPNLVCGVFVDNRPEAYSAAFFENIYVPMQEDENVWKRESTKYDFNTIFFSHKDATPWGQKFLSERLKDPAWKQVYLDDYAIIFTKVKP
ncbi:MAG: hypothetical protein Q8Q46_02405 [Candidatus Giovannonibacteria bacterium]|nr:hypothetical protein [Candidatus Giovannonibacteria bacterium]